MVLNWIIKSIKQIFGNKNLSSSNKNDDDKFLLPRSSSKSSTSRVDTNTSLSNKNNDDEIVLPKQIEKRLSLRELDIRKKTIQEEKERIKQTSTDWYKISAPECIKEVTNNVFQAYKFGNVLTLKELKEERLKKEARELQILEESVKVTLAEIALLVEERKVDDAKHKLNTILTKKLKVKSLSLRQEFRNVQSSIYKLEKECQIELEKERQKRLAEERRRREEEIQRQKEAEERAKKEKEKKEREEQERREANARRLAEEARQKENAERQERQRLENLSSEKKDDWKDFKRILDENDIQYLYHFTDVRNIPSIKRHGGLFSWDYCDKHNIKIPCQGGNDLARNLDRKYGLQDYVRLSFCEDHPMAHRLRKSGSDITILRVKTDVALLKDVQFSDMNATDRRHQHGKTLRHLKMVDFDATKMIHLRGDDPKFKHHQAEVMVRTFVPLKYIENI